MTPRSEPAVTLGSITCPSGRLMIADTGYLGLWSGAEPPRAAESVLAGIDDPELRASVAAAADLAITGPDAERAARGFGRQRGPWLYDIPAHGVEKITGAFAAHCREHGLDARLEHEPSRVPHRDRAERCVARGGGEFVMHGVPVVAAGGLPAGRELPVTAVRRRYGPRDDRWESVSVRVGDGEAASSTPLGAAGVDAARLSLADAGALASWEHDDPLDGLADLAFWGRSADEAAAHFDAPPLGRPGEDGVRGWADRDVRETVERAVALQDWVAADPDRRLGLDFRPHSHHWQVMAQVRASEHETGRIEVGGAWTLCFMTGWGDGLFPVFADHDAAGSLVAVRIVLGEESRARHLEELYADSA